ncbi:hypothetical protein HID58_060521 [Brassica napus]|uniref:Uncharacterized protein n=1 Tax=Brassica napus TaxID=3708 RepID=A0ABQ7ZX00_BRANA|nr:hypothetical protein HID58_060521 [Brassica napus]
MKFLRAISGGLTLSSLSSFFSHSPSSPNHHHDHNHRPLPSVSHIHVVSVHLVTTVPLLVFSTRNLSFFISLSLYFLIQYQARSLRSDESGESEMSSVGEETELNFDFHGVLLCVRASSLRDEMESSEKRREEMDLAQRRGRRWTYKCLLALMHQCPCLSRLLQAVYYGCRAEILVQRASFPDEFTRLTTIMWIYEIVLKHAYYKDQA